MNMARRLFQSYFCQLYHVIVFFVYLSSLIGIICCCFLVRIFLIFGVQRETVGLKFTLSVVRATPSVVYITLSVVRTTLTVVNIYAVGCIHYTVGCKHLLCRLYALLYRL